MHTSLITISFCIWFILVDGHRTINDQDVAIEMLLVNIRPGDMERYLTLDKQIWTSFLKQQDGFINKHNLLSKHASPNNATQVYHVIEWASYNQWKQISIEQLTKISAEFVQSLGYTPDMKSLPDSDGFHLVQP